MKKLLFAFCMLTFSLGMMAQEDKPKSNWIVGEQESSFPGQMIKYAVCQSPTVIKGEKGDITVSLNVMEFRGNTSYFFKSTGEDFKVDYNVTQRVLLQVDDESENFYALEGSNNYTSNSLKFPSGSAGIVGFASALTLLLINRKRFKTVFAWFGLLLLLLVNLCLSAPSLALVSKCSKARHLYPMEFRPSIGDEENGCEHKREDGLYYVFLKHRLRYVCGYNSWNRRQ